MTTSTRAFRALVLPAILCLLAVTAGAGAEETGSLRIAVVNPGRLIAESKFAKVRRAQLDQWKDEITLTLKTWDRYHMLSPADQEALTKLVLKEATAPNNLTKA